MAKDSKNDTRDTRDDARHDARDTRTDRTVPVTPVVPAPVHTTTAQPAAANVPATHGVEPPQRQTLPADKQPQVGPSAASAVTSESNFNQSKTPQEKRASDQAATSEAAAQQAQHGKIPLPTSGQPLTKPEPDADYGDTKK
jgi:hypothetical protein